MQLDLVRRLDELENVIVVYINGRPISEPWISENINAVLKHGNQEVLAV